MCGITGFLDPSRSMGPAQMEAAVRAMASAMPHRGPDDEGTWCDPSSGVALGFRRLSIVDLSPTGHQPMVSGSGDSVLIFNGEIYNAESLRPALTASQVQFRGHSDSEVLLELAQAIGFEAALARIVGMFAMCWHDRRDGSTWLARDRMGEKPLYIARIGQTILFGSELKCLRAHPAFVAEIDPVGLSAYTRFGCVPHPHSIYRNVQVLPPGGFARITPDGEMSIRRYWTPEKAASEAKAKLFVGSENDAIDALESLLSQSIKGSMVADVPLGAFLSGGIDSSTVVALMQVQSSRPVKTFSIGFDIPGFNEAPHAKAVAKHLGSEHDELYFSAKDVIDLVPQLPEIWDEPFADSSQLPTLMVSRMARQHVTVALSGDGGDELFDGYDRYRQLSIVAAAAGRSAGLVAPAGRAIHHLVNMPALAPVRRSLPPVFRARLDRWSARLAEAPGQHGLERVYRRLVAQGSAPEDILLDPQEKVSRVWRGGLADIFPGAVERAQMIDTLTYLPDDILVKVDRASMANSLETRAPLLDHRLFEFAWSLPAQMKRRDGVGKWALRQVLYRHVPRSLVERPKMGFGVPIDVWLRGPLRDWAEDLLDVRKLQADGLFKPEAVRLLWTRHQSGEQWQYPLWTILMLQAWRARWGH